MAYINTLITVASDCPVSSSEVPTSAREKKPQHIVQYDIVSQHPYQYNHEQLIFEAYLQTKDLTSLEREEKKELWAKLMTKSYPCMRASALTKRYGFGAHYDAVGNIALYPMESMVYKKFVKDKDITKLAAMRNKK
jgi:hypothetical protein